MVPAHALQDTWPHHGGGAYRHRLRHPWTQAPLEDLRQSTLEEAKGNCKGRIFRWYDKPCRDSLVRSSWDRCEGTQNQANRRVRRNEARHASSFVCGTKTTLPLWNCGRCIAC